MPLSRTDNRWVWKTEQTLTLLPDSAVTNLLQAKNHAGLSSLANIPGETISSTFAAPVGPHQEIWAAGVTYESSKFARMAESEDGGDVYARVYVADRPELFFKATPSRCVGHGGAIRIRTDSFWNVPEPELAVMIAADRTILGFTVGNDVSSRDIEGANPLYLPQAKVYRQSCALGPWIMPAEEFDPTNGSVTLTIERSETVIFTGESNLNKMRRSVTELVDWLFRENEFPEGVVLLTGTGIIPDEQFSLQAGDITHIDLAGIGRLTNSVVQG